MKLKVKGIGAGLKAGTNNSASKVDYRIVLQGTVFLKLISAVGVVLARQNL